MKQNKSNWLIYAALAVAGFTGFLVYRNWKNNQPQGEPEPQPEPNKGGTTPKPVAGKPSVAKATELQNLIVRRFEQLNRAKELPAKFADGNFGKNSNERLKELRPETFKNFGAVTSGNVDKWIAALNADVAAAAKEISELKAKQTAKTALIDLANKLEQHLKKSPKSTIRLLNTVSATRHEFDAARGVYLPLGEKNTYTKNTVFKANEIVNRGNGQLGIRAGQFRYFVNSDQFITNT
jgi:hypothetical protein